MQNRNFLLFLVLIGVIVVAGVLFINKVAPPADTDLSSSLQTEAGQEASEPVPTTIARKYAPPTAINLYRMGDGESELALFTFKEMAKKYKGRAFFQNIDVEKKPEIASFYKVESVPVIIIKSSSKKIVFRRAGYVDEEELARRLRAAGMR